MINNQVIEKQKEFQRILGWPIDSILENDRNELSERYIFKLIEEAVELRREFPSVINPWSKHQKAADLTRVKEELTDVILFLVNILAVWRFSPDEMSEMIEKVQDNNFKKIKERKMEMLNSDILKIPNRISGIGNGSLSPKFVFVGQNPSKSITQGYKFLSNPEDGSSKVLFPVLEDLGIKLEDCYFTNLVKCTTPNNEKPDKELTDFYLEFYEKELDILRINNPGMNVVAMGEWVNENIPHLDCHIPHPATVLYGTDLEFYRDQVREELKLVL